MHTGTPSRLDKKQCTGTQGLPPMGAWYLCSAQNLLFSHGKHYSKPPRVPISTLCCNAVWGRCRVMDTWGVTGPVNGWCGPGPAAASPASLGVRGGVPERPPTVSEWVPPHAACGWERGRLCPQGPLTSVSLGAKHAICTSEGSSQELEGSSLLHTLVPCLASFCGVRRAQGSCPLR